MILVGDAYTLVVAGSRSFASMDDSEFDHWMNYGLDVLGTPRTIIQGGAPGVDRKADRWAYNALIDRVTYSADRKRDLARAIIDAALGLEETTCV